MGRGRNIGHKQVEFILAMYNYVGDTEHFCSFRRQLRKPQSMFDRRALEAFFKNRRNALSNAKKAKMKLTKQQQQQQQQQPQQPHPVAAVMRQPGGELQTVRYWMLN